jgi:hypothetical protein
MLKSLVKNMKSIVSCLTSHCSSRWLLVKLGLQQKSVSVLIPSLLMMMILLQALRMIMRSQCYYL